MRASLLAPTLILALVAAGCDLKGTPLEIHPEFDETFSFDAGLDDWSPRSRELGEPASPWEVSRSEELARTGSGSVKLRLDNLGGAGRIWIERRYEVEPHQRYDVEITLELASADFGGVDAWSLIAGAAPESPAATGAFNVAGTTDNGGTEDQGLQWVEKSGTMQVLSDDDGELFVYVGVWGTSVGDRTFHVDDVKVTMTRVGPPVA